MRAHAAQIIDWLRDQGATGICVDQCKHFKIRFDWRGKRLLYVASVTPSDSRSYLNGISTLRRMMGLVQEQKRVGARRTRRRYAPEPPIPVPSITGGKDWTAALVAHPGYSRALKQRLDAAWVALWRSCMRSAGGESRL